MVTSKELRYFQVSIFSVFQDYIQRETELDRCDLVAYHKQQNCSNIINPSSDVNATKVCIVIGISYCSKA